MVATLALALLLAGSPDGGAGPGLVARLRKGGCVLFMRHPATDPNAKDTDPLHLDNVAAQRQLTDAGRAQARAIGEAFRALKIPVGLVQSSAYQRAREAATLTGLGPVQVSEALTEPQGQPDAEAALRGQAVRAQLTAPPEKRNTNTLLVSHKPNLVAAAGPGFASIREGDIAVFEPEGPLGFKLLGIVHAEEWSAWASAASK